MFYQQDDPPLWIPFVGICLRRLALTFNHYRYGLENTEDKLSLWLKQRETLSKAIVSRPDNKSYSRDCMTAAITVYA